MLKKLRGNGAAGNLAKVCHGLTSNGQGETLALFLKAGWGRGKADPCRERAGEWLGSAAQKNGKHGTEWETRDGVGNTGRSYVFAICHSDFSGIKQVHPYCFGLLSCGEEGFRRFTVVYGNGYYRKPIARIAIYINASQALVRPKGGLRCLRRYSGRLRIDILST